MRITVFTAPLICLLFVFLFTGCLSRVNNGQTDTYFPTTPVASDVSEKTGIKGQLSLGRVKLFLVEQRTNQSYGLLSSSDGSFEIEVEPGIYSLILDDQNFLERENLLEKDLVVSRGMLTTVVNVRLIPIPIVSNVKISTASGSFTCAFDTDIGANSFLEYGSDESYGRSSLIDTNARTSHQIDVINVDSGATYHFRIIARRRNLEQAQFTSQDFTATIP